jgi:hypothetical protein
MAGFDPLRRPPPAPQMKHPPGSYKTYRINSPRDTRIIAACQQVGCEAYRNGWDTVVDESTQLGASQAHYIRTQSGRTFREMRTDAGWTVFRFEPHQRCFAEHKTRPEKFAVTGGVGNNNPLHIPPRVHARPEDWVEDLGEHQQHIIETQQRG